MDSQIIVGIAVIGTLPWDDIPCNPQTTVRILAQIDDFGKTIIWLRTSNDRFIQWRASHCATWISARKKSSRAAPKLPYMSIMVRVADSAIVNDLSSLAHCMANSLQCKIDRCRARGMDDMPRKINSADQIGR
jgi:hypothetical protein